MDNSAFTLDHPRSWVIMLHLNVLSVVPDVLVRPKLIFHETFLHRGNRVLDPAKRVNYLLSGLHVARQSDIVRPFELHHMVTVSLIDLGFRNYILLLR